MSATTTEMTVQPPRAAAAVPIISDVEDGEVTESDNDDVVVIVETPKVDAEVNMEIKRTSDETNKKVKSDGSETIDLTESTTKSESGSSKLARKRQNRTIRKNQEISEKVY